MLLGVVGALQVNNYLPAPVNDYSLPPVIHHLSELHYSVFKIGMILQCIYCTVQGGTGVHNTLALSKHHSEYHSLEHYYMFPYVRAYH
jgi:hypothetical protein